jgi:uncharacterized protein YjiS (DUF1127 family)
MALATLKHNGTLHGHPGGHAAVEFGGWVKHGCTAVTHKLALWMERSRQRTHLAAMDDRLLADIGMSRNDADAEFRKPFWRA